MNTGETDPQAQARLVDALRRRLAGAAGREVALVETHISYVLLTGTFAYKVKKAVRLGFLDFTSLAARRFYCQEELRLNRRLAPSIYLDVVTITGTPDAPDVEGAGAALEYAVKMREFAQDALFSDLVARGALAPARIDELAKTVAAFHGDAAAAAANGAFGAPEQVLALALANFSEMRPLLSRAEDRAAVDALDAWTRREFARLRPRLAARREDGFVRECHGDLHLANVALVDDRALVFDCIEFNAGMRWIDVMSEVAFTMMDLAHAGRPDLAHRYLDAYLEATGDQAGLGVLTFYLAYRACVRAKVACLRAAAAGGFTASFEQACRGYLDLARAYAEPARAAIVVMHGFAACGKSTLAQALLEAIGAVRLRSDVERKRLQGLSATARSASGIASGLYASAATRATYAYLARLARSVVESGRVALVDATFLERWQRDTFRELAARLGVPFVIVDVVAGEATLRARLTRRSLGPPDASEAGTAVLDHQLRTSEPLAPDERDDVVRYDSEQAPEREQRAVVAEVDARRNRDACVPGPARPSPAHAAPSLDAEVAFLSRPGNHPEGTPGVDTVETHLSFVFLTERHAWKLKKPVCTRHVDLRDADARLWNCIEETRLNRRLSTGVYLGVAPLFVDERGALSLTDGATVVDWLVRMRRLPASRMLDRMLVEGRVAAADLDALVARLCAFYRRARRIELRPVDYRDEFAATIAAHRTELFASHYGLDSTRIARISQAQLAMLKDADLFDARLATIVEGHGDLRPEHVCFEEEPQIIDCLEFSLRLRTLDPVDEVGFLALECERLGAPPVGDAILDAYRAASGDAAPSRLVDFYQSFRACVRATLAVRHLAEPAPVDARKWIGRANAYLDLAWSHIERSTR